MSAKPARITQAQVLAAASALGINHEYVTEVRMTTQEVHVTYIDADATSEHQGVPFVYTTDVYRIVKEPRP